MRDESFEDEKTAGILNSKFVPIKVDREERPEVDEVYMKAVTMLTGQGGWPLSVFLTPDLKPFYGGTYFPPVPRHGLPGFPEVHGLRVVPLAPDMEPFCRMQSVEREDIAFVAVPPGALFPDYTVVLDDEHTDQLGLTDPASARRF